MRDFRLIVNASLFLIAAVTAMPYEQSNQSQAESDSDLVQRLAQAETVVTGVVLSVTPVAAPPAGISQHNPEWQQATVKVESVEKGKVDGQTVHVLFSNSQDIAWSRSPKLKSGDHAVFLLHSRDPFGRSVPGLAIVQPADKQPVENVGKIRGLLANGGKK